MAEGPVRHCSVPGLGHPPSGGCPPRQATADLFPLMRLFFPSFLCLLLLLPSLSRAETLLGRVVRVADGDTVTLLDALQQEHRIRLSGIDAPEKGQAFGLLSKAALSSLVFGMEVRAECGKRDRYGRAVCKILLHGLDVNLEQVRAGMAWWYRHYQKEQSPADRNSYSEAESLGKDRRLGLWSETDPVPPWDWRHRK